MSRTGPNWLFPLTEADVPPLTAEQRDFVRAAFGGDERQMDTIGRVRETYIRGRYREVRMDEDMAAEVGSGHGVRAKHVSKVSRQVVELYEKLRVLACEQDPAAAFLWKKATQRCCRGHMLAANFDAEAMKQAVLAPFAELAATAAFYAQDDAISSVGADDLTKAFDLLVEQLADVWEALGGQPTARKDDLARQSPFVRAVAALESTVPANLRCYRGHAADIYDLATRDGESADLSWQSYSKLISAVVIERRGRHEKFLKHWVWAKRHNLSDQEACKRFYADDEMFCETDEREPPPTSAERAEYAAQPRARRADFTFIAGDDEQGQALLRREHAEWFRWAGYSEDEIEDVFRRMAQSQEIVSQYLREQRQAGVPEDDIKIPDDIIEKMRA